MKLQVADFPPFASSPPGPSRRTFAVECETDLLTDVLLCPPMHLAPVPCCSKTRQSVRAGFTLSPELAASEHRALYNALNRQGVRCHWLPPAEGMPDLCFTRDVTVTTPWGLVLLNPAMPHRKAEVMHVASTLEGLGAPIVRRIVDETIEGGDICVARPGLLVVAISGERTSEAGARSFAAPFRQAGWDVIECQLDPHFLHLDTVFCMLDRRTALACVDVLADDFLSSVARHGIRLIRTSYKEARALGGNVVSVDGRTILISAGQPRILSALRRSGFDPIEVPVSQFAACGGGLHCLTMPLARQPAVG